MSTPSSTEVKRPRRTSSCCWFTTKIIFVLVGLCTLRFGYLFLVGLVRALDEPHRDALLGIPVEDGDRMGGVKPLIDLEQTFDIAATVWLRLVGEREGEGKGKPEDDGLFEKPLYSDIIFRGLKLTDKGVLSSITFQLPTSGFKGDNFTNLDLRGSFVLIPNPSSPLDYLVNYTNYLEPSENSGIPNINYWPSRPWPFPLGSDEREKTLLDRAIDKMSTQVPLLSFHDVPSQEPDVMKAQPPFRTNTTEAVKLDIDSVLRGSLIQGSRDDEDIPKPLKARTCHDHPYVITRTHLRIIDEVRPFKEDVYMEKMNGLMEIACGAVPGKKLPSRENCTRSYRQNGNWETQFEVLGSGGVRELRYAPYLDTLAASYGPKDLVPVPVDRKGCSSGLSISGTSAESDDDEVMDITWNLSFSGLSPLKALIGDGFGGNGSNTKPHRFNETDYEGGDAQDLIRTVHGVLGHRSAEDIHPRRRVVFWILLPFLHVTSEILSIHYWYSLDSTVGITIAPTVLMGAIPLCWQVLNPISRAVFLRMDLLNMVWVLLISLKPFFKLRAALRMDIGWRGIKRWPASRTERVSERLDNQITMSEKLKTFGALAAVLFFTGFREMTLISGPVGPAVIPEDAPRISKVNVVGLVSAAMTAAHITNAFFQQQLNYRSQSFAGSYRIATFVRFCYHVVNICSGLVFVVGDHQTRSAISWDEFSGFMFSVGELWQALTLSLPRSLEDEHVE